MRQIAVRDEKWDLTEDETEDFSRLGKDLDALDARISEVDGQESRARQSDNAFSNVLGQPVDRAVLEVAHPKLAGVRRADACDFAAQQRVCADRPG